MHSFKYPRSSTSRCNDIGIIKFAFVIIAQLLYTEFYVFSRVGILHHIKTAKFTIETKLADLFGEFDQKAINVSNFYFRKLTLL